LLLGGTGVGKSTTIHYLAGSEMASVEVPVSGNGKTFNIQHIHPQIIKNDFLREVKSSPYAQSETRYITAISVKFSDIGLPNHLVLYFVIQLVLKPQMDRRLM
jgi:translation initiation factor RLI1